MAIQFTCVSCRNAIEIDDKWAHRLVECPYCHDTVRSPGRSMLTESPPLASPVEGDSTGEAPIAASEPMHAQAVPMQPTVIAQAPPDNKLAIVALVLAIGALVLLAWTSASLGQAVFAHVGPDATPADMQRIVQEAAERQEPWVYRASLSLMGSFGLWIAGAVCSLIAISRRGRRGIAIAAIALSALPLVLLLFSLTAM